MSTGKQKLYTYGCSFTYGQGLPDCIDLSQDFGPSKFAWPHLVSQKLNIAYKNYSDPGCTCQEVTRRFLYHSKDFNANDIVVIVWPYFHRYLIPFEPHIDRAWKYTVLGTDYENPFTGKMISIQDFYDNYSNPVFHLEEFLKHSKLVHDTCKSLGVHLINYIFDSDDKREFMSIKSEALYHWYDVNIERSFFDLQECLHNRYNKVSSRPFEILDCGHYGHPQHEYWAEKVSRLLRRRDIIE